MKTTNYPTSIDGLPDMEHASPYRYPDIVAEYRKAWKHITQSSCPVKNREKRSVRVGKAAAVLDIAAKLFQPGDVVAPSQIADYLGISRYIVANAVKTLRRTGNWPYKGGVRGIHFGKAKSKNPDV